jgi:hypothetical protein
MPEARRTDDGEGDLSALVGDPDWTRSITCRRRSGVPDVGTLDVALSAGAERLAPDPQFSGSLPGGAGQDLLRVDRGSRATRSRRARTPSSASGGDAFDGITGGPGADTLATGGGADRVEIGRGGADRVRAGDGDDGIEASAPTRPSFCGSGTDSAGFDLRGPGAGVVPEAPPCWMRSGASRGRAAP